MGTCTVQYILISDFNSFQLFSEQIPYIQKAQKLSNGSLLLFGSPWSSPAWMKTSHNMSGKGSLIGKPGGKYYKAWALYFVR